jgi:phosphoribosylformimino-5-aminoimidazole carboxamide ribonucleotide (ProFAR) isomerase
MEVAVRGWVAGSGADLIETARRFDVPAVSALVVTSIGVDGTLEGPDLEQLAAVVAATSVPVVASGGVGTLDDLRALRGLRVGDRALAGVIAGKAIYERKFTVADALAAVN